MFSSIVDQLVSSRKSQKIARAKQHLFQYTITSVWQIAVFCDFAKSRAYYGVKPATYYACRCITMYYCTHSSPFPGYTYPTAPKIYSSLFFVLQNQTKIIKTITSLKLSLNLSGRGYRFLPPVPFLHFIHAFVIPFSIV